jgi:hypothetical protein
LLTLNQLLNLTRANYDRIHSRSKLKINKQYITTVVKVVDDRVPKGQKYRAVSAIAHITNKKYSNSWYNLTIRNYGTKRNPKDYVFKPESKLWVHCSCPYFKFYLAVVLHMNGSSEITDIPDLEDKMPNVRNPAFKPYLCKHLYGTILNLRSRDMLYKGQLWEIED